jgi:hypothetical protein
MGKFQHRQRQAKRHREDTESSSSSSSDEGGVATFTDLDKEMLSFAFSAVVFLLQTMNE